MSRARRKQPILARFEGNGAFLTLAALLMLVFFTGGGSRGDILSLVVLRPVAILCLALGLIWMPSEQWRLFRVPLGLMGALIGLHVLHLIPLPPALWGSLPGREIAVSASALVDAENIWRPLALVPYRAWNALYALLVPAAALVLAAQLREDQHRAILYIVMALIALSALVGFLQVVSGYNPALFFYRVTNADSSVGLFANKNHQAAALCLLLPMLALIGSRAKGTARATGRIASVGAALVVLTLILATGSRAGVIFAALALAGSWFVVSGRPHQVLGRTHKQFPLGPVALAAAALIASVSLAVIFSRTSALDRLVASDSVEENRFEVWRVILGFFWQYQPFGAGFGSFVEVFQIHEPNGMLATRYWNHAHNDWLEWVLDGGVPVASLLAAALVALVRAVIRLRSQFPGGKLAVQLATVGAVALFTLFLWSLVDYPLRTPTLACLAAVAAVWVVGTGQGRHMA